jgi:16S rRNA (uracil1498-N3)-methyltransferase
MKNCVVKLDDKKSQTKIDRWNKISLSAATQSKRGIVPEVGNVINFDYMISKLKDDGNTYILYESADSETISNFNKIINTKDYINIIIGPEGGFSSDEIKKAKENNIKFLTLGKRILRTETAAIAFLSYVMINYELNNN